ncbi:MAG: EAL domain-containing protein [Rhodoferax sp.]|uniref:bifunctional diguanylate cyclase/phosphodiesterase n=1 Tax=Rhodoferax sp. TaxID=50421 RepID=UPI001B55FB45|nr:EAL domain-containing protein [Rhodoferax sp.]MBP9905587.1 EAL domain-containing protein [Rhodoferax sp.]
MTWPRFARGLRFRLFIASLLIELVMMVVLVGNSLRLIDTHLVRQTERRLTAIELAYKTAVALPLAARDYASLRDVLDGWRQAEDITYLVVTDPLTNTLASSNWPEDQALPEPSADFSNVDVLHVRFPVDVLGQSYGMVHYGLSMEFLKTARRDLMFQGALIASIELLLSFLVLYGVGYWLTRHLAHLTEASSRIAAGNYQIRVPHTSNDEVGQLTQNFNHMAEAVQSRVAELGELLARQKIILQALGEGVYGQDRYGRCTFINPAALAMLGLTEGQALGADPHALFHHSRADGVPYAVADCPAHQTSLDGQPRQSEDWFWRQNGRGFPVALIVTPLLADGVIQGAVVAFRDISESREAARALQESHQRLSNFIDALPDIVVIKDGQSRWQLVNLAAREALALDDCDWMGKNNAELAQLRPAFQAFHEEAQQSDEHAWQSAALALSTEHIFAQGDTPRISEVRKMPIFAADGSRLALMVIARDITERLQTESQLRKLSLAVEQSPENIVITDLAGRIEYVNAALVTNTGYSRDELLGNTTRVFKSGKTPPETYPVLWTALKAGEIWRGEFINRRKDASEYTETATIAPVRGADGNINHYLAVKQDVTEQRKTQAQIYRLAYHDTLTGLPNRVMLLERLELALALAKRQQMENSFILFNIDRFKNLNDARGHRQGDLLLIAVSERLGHLLREGDLLTRVAADEFAILLLVAQGTAVTASRHALSVSERIHEALLQPFDFGDEVSLVTASLGITHFPLGAEDSPQEVLRRADTALHRAKDAGGNQSAFFDVAMGELTQQRFQIEHALRQGIGAGELRLYIQPQVDAGRQLVSGEVLVRWQHPERGLLPPGVFIPIAEESDLIIELENWVTRETCRLLAREELDGYPLRLSVNISPRHFRQSGFVNWLLGLMQQEGCDPAYLTLEITEGMVIDNIDELIAKMNRLSKLGVHFSIDDFGTGYSSLAYLKRLPIDELKIDKTFVQDAPSNPDDGALVETILAIARHLHLKVVAEGVETQAQADFLNARAEVVHQGYLYGRPEPAEFFLSRRRLARPDGP